MMVDAQKCVCHYFLSERRRKKVPPRLNVLGKAAWTDTYMAKGRYRQGLCRAN